VVAVIPVALLTPKGIVFCILNQGDVRRAAVLFDNYEDKEIAIETFVDGRRYLVLDVLGIYILKGGES